MVICEEVGARSLSINGRVSSVSTLSTVDGPGARCVLFLQGCPLRCSYCHNPETWDRSCGSCNSLDQVLDGFDRARRFHRGLGLTLSGGEPLMQPEFALSILRHVKAQGVHTAVDTCGDVPPQTLSRVIPFTDLFLYDVKAVESELHREITGRGNRRILENLRILSENGCRIWLRRVLIPGVNDSREEAILLRRLLQSVRVEKVEILPFHRLGMEKWRSLGLVSPYEEIDSATEDDVMRFGAMAAIS